MKKTFSTIIAIAVIIALAVSVISGCQIEKTEALDERDVQVAEHYVIGSGGYGAVTNAQIDPFDENCYAFTCDMGGVYFSRGAVVRFEENNTTYRVLIDGLFDFLKNISFGATDNVLYVTSWGGGTEKIVLTN